MRVVLDTNILISALLTHGSNSEIVDKWLNGDFMLLTSKAQIDEFKQVARRKRSQGYASREDIGIIINALRDPATAELVSPKKIRQLSPDPDDDLIIAIATEGNADYLVSLDNKHVVRLRKVSSTPILHSRDFLKRLN